MLRINSHTHAKIPLEFNEILTSNQTMSQRVKVESQGVQARFASYSERRPSQRELLGAAHCRPEELKGPSLVLQSIESQDD